MIKQSWTSITTKSTCEVVIYLAYSSNIFFLSSLAFQLPSPPTHSQKSFPHTQKCVKGSFTCTTYTQTRIFHTLKGLWRNLRSITHTWKSPPHKNSPPLSGVLHTLKRAPHITEPSTLVSTTRNSLQSKQPSTLWSTTHTRKSPPHKTALHSFEYHSK